MVIGNGTMAKAFTALESNKEILIFASGVANSKETLPKEFEREIKLLNECIAKYSHLHFVYFSTCSIYDLEEQASPYVEHKLLVEEIIKQQCPTYNIFRISNVGAFTTNTTTIFNYLVNNIKNQTPFKLWSKAYRNILAIEDISKVVVYLLKDKNFANKTINIANPKSYSVRYLVQEIENFLQLSADYELIDKGKIFAIDTTIVEPIFFELGIHFDNEYIQKILSTHYSYIIHK
jgi:nucleoside-diphosphate-sugar epimerase